MTAALLSRRLSRKEADMIPVLFKQQMRELDAHMSNVLHIPPLLLMENAAFGLTTAIFDRFGAEKKIIALCGTGNNGGDGFAAARQLAAKGCDVKALLVGETKDLHGDAAVNAAYFGSHIIQITDEASAKTQFADIINCVVIDALFGIGLARDIGGLYATVISLLNQSGAYVVACDIASGIDADTGAVRGIAVRADETVTFGCAKPGHYLFPGREHTGILSVKEIGISDGFDIGKMYAVTNSLRLPARAADTHKGSFGRLACVVGSQGMAGAGLLCTGAALRAGAGLVTAGVPSGLQSIFSARLPDSMTYALDEFSGSLSENCTHGLEKLLSNITALAAGPGLSAGSGVAAAVRYMLAHHDIRKVFDADALNIIAQDKDILQKAVGDIVLTPHPAEFSRLCGLDLAEIQKDPLRKAQEFAKEFGVTLLLKGATTIVTNGEKTAFVTAGTPGMARGGSGDVLTGVIGGLMCGGQQGGMNGFDAAVYGAAICGKAGEAAARNLGALSMTASDTLAHIAAVTKEMMV